MTTSKEIVVKALFIILFLLSGLSMAEIPNAFNPNELGSGTIAGFIDSCATGVDKSVVKVSADYKYIYCSCIADWFSENPKELFRQELPGANLIKKCSEKALARGKNLPLRNEFNSKKDAAIQIWERMNYCQRQFKERLLALNPDEMYKNTDLYLCSCHGDYARNNPKSLGTPIPDEINHQCALWFEKQAQIRKIPIIKRKQGK